jgi:uncharacterized protein with PQ loop repeat
MNFLQAVPEPVFETIGVCAGLGACFVIAIQVWKEYKSALPSSLSMGFVFGWVIIYGFWALYGLRFETLAIWLTNGIAMMLQIVLCTIVMRKRKLNNLNKI